MIVKWIAATLLALSVTACAAPLRVETKASGAPILNGGRYMWLLPEAEQPHLPEASRIRMTQALAAKGLMPAGQGEKPDYLLLVNHARRPAKVGLATMDPPSCTCCSVSSSSFDRRPMVVRICCRSRSRSNSDPV